MVRKNLYLREAGAAAALVLALGCQGQGTAARSTAQLQEVLTNQRQILTKLDNLAKAVDSIEAGGGRPQRGRQAGRPDPKAVYKVPVGDAHAMGPADAKVTIVEWSDFECPFCNRVIPTIKELKASYGDDLRVVFKHNPLPMHRNAMPAALAAEAAGKQGKFWEMHDRLFENRSALTQENFEKWSAELGLDVEQFKKDMQDPKLKQRIAAMQTQGTSLGARGTPAFFVNGRFLSGAQPVAAFKSLIDEEMKRAEKELANGTPAGQLYDKLIAKGKTKP